MMKRSIKAIENEAIGGMERQNRENIHWQKLSITRKLRAEKLGQTPKTLWFTGLSGSGKSTVANALEKMLYAEGMATMLLDGDNLRMGLNCDLGFKAEDRIENIRRVAEVAKLMNDAGLIVLVCLISPFEEEREHARTIIGEDSFVEIYMNTSLETCEGRDVKGLYKKARNGEILNFSGISSPYEAPSHPNIVIDTAAEDIVTSVNRIRRIL